MELNRLIRILRDRWVLVVIVGLTGFLAALVFAWQANRLVEPTFEATATLKFEPDEGQTIADLTDDIQSAAEIASFATAELRSQDDSLQIISDPGVGRILFVAAAPTQIEAGAKAQALIQAYFNVDPTIGGDVDSLLSQLEDDANSLQAQIDDLQPHLTSAEQALVSQHDLLDRQIAAVNSEIIAVAIADATATPVEQQDNAARTSFLKDRLSQLQQEKAALPPPPSTELTIGEQFRLDTLKSRLELLSLDYQRLYLRKLGVTGIGRAEPVVFSNLTSSPADPTRNGVFGMMGGLVVGLFALVLIDRTRRPVWLAEDLNIPFLGEVPQRRVTSDIGETWYDSAEPGTRKRSIQALRLAIESQISPEGATLALSGHNVSAPNLQALASDLAVSLASSGASILLVDVDMEGRAALGEYRVGGSSLSEILKLNPEVPGFEIQLRAIVENAHLIRPGLAVMPSGPPPMSPADALAGSQFRTFVDQAQERFDLVILSVGEVTSAHAQVALQRAGQALMVLTPGRSARHEIDSVFDDLIRRQVRMLGVVFLPRRDDLFGSHSVKFRFARVSEPWVSESSSESPVSRLGHYPVPGERGSALIKRRPLNDFADQVSESDEEHVDLGDRVLSALTGPGSSRAPGAVGGYLMTRIEDMMAATYGQGGLPDDLVFQVVSKGFVPLFPLAGHLSLGRWLEEEIKAEVAGPSADLVIEQMRRAISGSDNAMTSFDSWIARHFFSEHLRRTGGEASIWHLTSEDGTVQVLAPAVRLDRSRIENLITEVAGAAIDELERLKKAANTRGDLEQAAVYDSRIREVQSFKGALGRLAGQDSIGRSRTNKKNPAWVGGWNPDWSKGYRANMAPLQWLGLFPFSVLSEEEMMSGVFATG